MNKTALILVDLQNDFCEGGGLAVPQGDEVIPLANALQPFFNLVVATKDWHPHDHMSFASNHPEATIGQMVQIEGRTQILWPDHCVQHTQGAAFHPLLQTQHLHKIFHKGVDKKVDSYSAFFDNAHQRSTGLSEFLRMEGVATVYLLGLATDYCVKYSCFDAVKCGFEVYVIEDACRGVELNHGDTLNAIQEMQTLGAHIIQSREILQANQ